MPPVSVDPKRVREFKDAQSFYDWLGKHWNTEPEVWLKIHKVHSGLASITPSEAIEVVLCWGWIDGIRKGFDQTSFLQRYSPRRKTSVWSQINVASVERLIKNGRMQAPGLLQVAAAKEDGQWQKAYNMAKAEAPEDLLAAIRAVPRAQAMYETLSSQNRFALTFRTMNMKTAEGRRRKIAAFVEMLRKGETIHPTTGTASAPTSRQRRREKP